MNDKNKRNAVYREAFRQIAEVLEQLPSDKQQELREQLGNYTHDLKHFLGLVTGATSLMQRDEEVALEYGEVLDIILQATADINLHYDLLVQNLVNQIDVNE